MSYWLLTFARRGSASYLSHLDTARAWRRTFARAGIDLVLSQGMRPKPRLALGLPLPVGAAATEELLLAEVSDLAPEPEMALPVLALAAPPGLEPLAAMAVPDRPRPQALTADYECGLAGDEGAIAAALAWFAAAESVPIERVSPKGQRTVDLKEFVTDTWCRPTKDGVCVGFTVRHRSTGAARPQEFVSLVAGRAGVEAVARHLLRRRVVYTGLPAGFAGGP
jgi:radical SAM-linked protein